MKVNLPTWMLIVLTALLTFCISGSAAYYFGYLAPIEAVHDHVPGEKPEAEDKQLWTCGMHPWIITEAPGQCPICGMDLTPKRDTGPSAGDTGERQVAYWLDPADAMGIYSEEGISPSGEPLSPVYEDELISGVSVKIDPVTRQNMGVRTATAKKGILSHTIRTYGHITYDETRIVQVSPKFNGWIEKLHADFTGQFVEKDEPLFDIYSPDLLAAQEEYLGAFGHIRNRGNPGSDLLASAQRRLLYYDVAESEIREMERTGKVQKSITMRSPFTGIVTHKNAVEGAFIKAGTALYTIADLSRVWAEAHIYEYELPWVKIGQDATMHLSFHPGEVYAGKVTYIYPYLQQKTRDVVVRLEFENPDMALKPDMFADVRIRTESKGEGLVIPAEAVLRSGRRNLVFVEREPGKFIPREVSLGLSLDENHVQVREGIAPGDRVVTSGQFLLDSESKLKEAVAKMMEIRQPGTQKPPASGSDGFFDGMEAGEDDFFSDMAEGDENADFFEEMK